MSIKNFTSKIYSAREKLKDIFGSIELIDSVYSILTGTPKIDVIKLDDYLIHKFGYDIEKHGSQSDFIKSKFGNDAEEFVRSLL